jgi:hypothetical protein
VLSTGHLVDRFFPQHMTFRYRAPGFADARFTRQMSRRQRPRPLISFKQIDHLEQCWVRFSGILMVAVNNPIGLCSFQRGAAPGWCMLRGLLLAGYEQLQKLQLPLYCRFKARIGIVENPQSGVDLGDAFQEQGVLGIRFQGSPDTLCIPVSHMTAITPRSLVTQRIHLGPLRDALTAFSQHSLFALQMLVQNTVVDGLFLLTAFFAQLGEQLLRGNAHVVEGTDADLVCHRLQQQYTRQ